MSITIADQYYLKALDDYPYDLEISMENLNYALSYDPDHDRANCLMGLFYQEQIRDYEQAEYYYQLAIGSNPQCLQAYEEYAYLSIVQRDFKKAEKLIRYASGIDGADLATLLYLEAMLYEYQHDYENAERLLEAARVETYNNQFMEYLDKEIQRVQTKSKNEDNYVYRTE